MNDWYKPTPYATQVMQESQNKARLLRRARVLAKLRHKRPVLGSK